MVCSMSRSIAVRCFRSIPPTSLRCSWGRPQPLDLKTMYSCPESEKAAYREAIWFPHQIFLGPRADIDAIVEAMHKVLKNIESLRDLDAQSDPQPAAVARRPRELSFACGRFCSARLGRPCTDGRYCLHFRDVQTAKLVALVSRDLERARRLGEVHGVAFSYDSLDECLANPEVEAVYIVDSSRACTCRKSTAVARAGRHVLCEKPLAVTAAEAAEMVATCARAVSLVDDRPPTASVLSPRWSLFAT